MERQKKAGWAEVVAAGIALVWCFFAILSATAWRGWRVEKENIPFSVKERKSDFVQKGWTIWLQEGENGYKNSLREIVTLGKKRLIDKILFKTDIIKNPKEGIKVSGISDKKHPITVPQETYAHAVHLVEATAYDPSPESNSVKWAGITSLGWRARHGIAAVDPRVISLRRLIYVDGYGFAWTGDVGGAIKGKKIDLCYNTTEEAFRWGRKKVKAYVLGTKPASFYEAKKKAKQEFLK
jgi:3D (Asp-Asp-Asp) domain-containing protein